MFSGIKYIFGYTEETVASPTVNDVVTAPSVPVENTDVPAASADTSTTNLEQTLNSATTKFAEQLLPQQASIEQLQSSSHQLLPSIIEQHEEDELKKKSPTCESAQSGGVGDDDDEDGFNAESWELLDLVEKVADDEEAPVSLSSSVQKDGSLAQGISKSTSGILKSQNTNDNGTLQARQKPKVSFEAPDLVKFKQGIEQTKSNVAAAKAASGSGKASKGAEDFKVSVVAVKDDVCGQNVPILNYAKALSSKIRAGASVNPSGKITEPLAASPSKLADEEASNLNGPVKRVRPTRVSTSSWSSHDDEEEDDIEQVQNADWEGFYEKPGKKQPLVSAVQIVDADDNESVISSGFSDCDYGFGGNNDYVMRPKKANVKRGRSSSSKLGSTSGTKASRSDKKVAKGKLGATVEAKSSEVPSKSTDAKDHKSETPSSSRNSKPKKKRMIMSTNNKSVNLSDFLKPRPGSSRGSSSSKEVGHQVSLKKNNSSSKQLAQKQPTISSSGVGGGSGSTESSDVADMDESWFVTPPSCFTGAARTTVASGKVGGLPKNKEADRENALIEHPSIYIANTASRSPVKAQGAPTAKPKLAGNSTVEVVTSKPNNSASKILEKLEDESWNSGDDDDDDDDDVNFDDDQLMPTSKLAEVTEKTGASGSHEVVSIITTTTTTATTTTAAEVVKPSSEMTTTDSTTSTVGPSVKNKEDGKRVTKAKAKQKSAKMVVLPPKRNLEKQKARASSSSSSTATMKPSENKAWKNKFIVDAWDLDENEDADSDFDNMFESSVKKRKSPLKTKKQQQQQQQKQAKLKKVTDEDNMSSLGSNEIASYENDASSSSVELLSVKSLESQEFENNENLELSLSSIADNSQEQILAQPKQSTAQQPSALKSNAGAGENRRPPTQVRPIEPERVPSWLLKRQRSRRRPLGTASVVNKQQPQSPASSGAGVSSFKASSSKTKDESLASGSSSSRSTPTLIDRIGCSIVANLTNLTSGLVSSGAMNYCPSSGRPAMIESQEKTVATKSSLNNYAGGDHVARKQLSRGSIRRQNICSKQGNSLRRPDRRLKLFATPNGCSINRKVHTSIH